MTISPSAVVTYANNYWYRPCKDGRVWLANEPVNIANEIASRRLSPSDWVGALLCYPGQSKPDRTGTRQPWTLEGLYLVKMSDAPRLRSNQVAASYPDAIMLASWYDSATDESLTRPPRYTGLNDCAHFVTECLAAGGEAQLRTVSVPVLLNSLTTHNGTKTLARTVDQAAAQRIIDAGLLNEGDVMIFSKTLSSHGHSTSYLGGGYMAMHTMSNHKDSTIWTGSWTGSMTAEHNLVTLIHWNVDDNYSTASDGVLGWWSVMWRGTTYYYFFQKGGRVSYTKTAPTNLKNPPTLAQGKGWWFETSSGVDIAWTSTGSYESFMRPVLFTGSAMAGLWNNAEPMVAAKL